MITNFVAVAMNVERKIDCLAWDKDCSNRRGRNHFTTKCKKNNIRVTNNNRADTRDKCNFSKRIAEYHVLPKKKTTHNEAVLLVHDQKSDSKWTSQLM